MSIVNVHSLFKRRALVTRESAEALRDSIVEASEGTGKVTLDLKGIEAVTPSFIDQILLIVGESLGRGSNEFEILVLNPPTRLSSRFAAIGRAHQVSVTEDPMGNWIISRARAHLPRASTT